MTVNTAVLDVGKTLTKLSLWSPSGEPLAKLTHSNRRVDAGGYRALDVEGIQHWLGAALSVMGRKAPIGAIVPVGHGAAAVIVRDGQIVCAPMDYEQPIAVPARARYDAARDPFVRTGSPALPDGLNLGAQLDMLERLDPNLWRGPAQILLWPQYWAWFLSGIAASEVTSLGCHSDLWNPAAGQPSQLAVRRGWAERLPPLRRADEVLGVIDKDLALRTGLARDVKIYCGIHDTNAALLAARGFPELRRREATMLSTGTWFVAMRTPGVGLRFDPERLSPQRDCLINVDADGRMVPSARFMGGREIEHLTQGGTRRLDNEADQSNLIGAVARVLERQAMILPNFARGCGPYPDLEGRWINRPETELDQRAAAGLYAALIADTAIDLIDGRERILVEGRFAAAQVVVRALASLRERDTVYACHADNDVSFGALRLIDPELRPQGSLVPVAALPMDLAGYRDRWRQEIARQVAA